MVICIVKLFKFDVAFIKGPHVSSLRKKVVSSPVCVCVCTRVGLTLGCFVADLSSVPFDERHTKKNEECKNKKKNALRHPSEIWCPQ